VEVQNIRFATGYFVTTIANGLVYFGGFDGILYAVDAQTGT
jgi:outer membrane protein assembly factor BamB